MPDYQLSRTVVIEAPLQKVRESLIDYRQWPTWSPWLVMDRKTKLSFSEDQSKVGASYRWDGDLTGQGEMILSEINDNNLCMALTFIKPFKSFAEVSFDLETKGSATHVTWHMKSKLPFFLFWMIKKIKVLIGMDYERGLTMLKEYLETGSVASTVTIDGIHTYDSQKYIGIERNGSIVEMQKNMSDDFMTLHKFIAENDMTSSAPPFTIYKVFDIFDKHCHYIAAISVDTDLPLPDSFMSGELDVGEGLKVTHTGRYENLGNAWSTAVNFSRSKKIKTKKSPAGIEIYLNDPTNIPPEDLVTQIILPLK